jgi:starch phosphorylase
MKFALNGALTIGTLDGANIEIMEEVGSDNIYIFGLKADEINELKSNGAYNPVDTIMVILILKGLWILLQVIYSAPMEPELFNWVYYNILKGGDTYFHLADLMSYKEAHQRADADFNDKSLWASKAILNVARTGKFSSDRIILEYSRDIWKM